MAKPSSKKRRQRRKNASDSSVGNTKSDASPSGLQSGKMSTELIPTATDNSSEPTSSNSRDTNATEGSYRVGAHEIIQDSSLPINMEPSTSTQITQDRDIHPGSLKSWIRTRINGHEAQLLPVPNDRLKGDINGQNGVDQESPAAGEEAIKDRMLSWLPGLRDVMEFIVKHSSCRAPECPFFQDPAEQREGQEQDVEDRRARTTQPPRARTKDRLLQSLPPNPTYEFHTQHRNMRDLRFDPRELGFHKKGACPSRHYVTRFIIISPNLTSIKDGPKDFTFIFETVGPVGVGHGHHWGMIRLSAKTAAPLIFLITQCGPKRLKIGVGLREKALIHHCATVGLDEFDGQAIFEELDTTIKEAAEQAVRKSAQAALTIMLQREAFSLKLLSPVQRFHAQTGTFSTELNLPSEVSHPLLNTLSGQDKSPPLTRTNRRSGMEESLRKAVVVSEARKAAEAQARERLEENIEATVKSIAVQTEGAVMTSMAVQTERVATTSTNSDALGASYGDG